MVEIADAHANIATSKVLPVQALEARVSRRPVAHCDHDVVIRASGEAHEAMPGVARGCEALHRFRARNVNHTVSLRARHPAFDPVEVPIGLMQ